MSYSCYPLLNRREMTTLNCPGIGSFPAFSGQKEGRNNPDKTSVPDIGPLREKFLKEIYGTVRTTWFALYRDDGKKMIKRLYRMSDVGIFDFTQSARSD